MNINLTNVQSKAKVISANETAVNDGNYTVVANATFTDPSPIEGKGFRVFVRNGTAIVGGTSYSVAGTEIVRLFHSGSWSNYVIDMSSKQDVSIVVNSNITAENDKVYHVVANATFTDPTGVNGKGYVVVVRAGSATIGGNTGGAGTINYRLFQGGTWTTYQFWNINQLLNIVEVLSNKKTTLADNSDTFYPTQKAVKTAVDAKQDALTETNFGAFTNGLTSKTTPIDADSVNIIDSADSNKAKRVTFANLKAFLKEYFDTIYTTTTAVATQITTVLSGYVPTSRTINGLDLSVNRTLSASDVGAPSGSGTSTGTNTGDETQSSILTKLGFFLHKQTTPNS
ncbi:MAG: hypothetical protein FGM14_14040, partial [Flavobacteriales bacterium]|nr:hypothetical protein [Flavobacteriales bacterium]